MADPKITIVTDSSAFIPEEALAGLDVKTIPLWLLWDGESLQDGVDIQSDEFYRRLRTARNLATTSQPTPQEFKTFFQDLSAEADAIVAVLVSSEISGTYESAVMARDQLPEMNISVVDSRISAMALGYCVIAAARAAAAGKPVEEVVKAAEEMRDKVNLLFVVDTLEYLHRSGRIKASKRYLGTALQIKPILHFQDGLIQPVTSVRTMKKAIGKLMELAEERLGGKRMAEACIMDIDAPERGDEVADLVRARFNPGKVLRSGVSPVVGNVNGPGAFGFAFYGEE